MQERLLFLADQKLSSWFKSVHTHTRAHTHWEVKDRSTGPAAVGAGLEGFIKLDLDSNSDPGLLKITQDHQNIEIHPRKGLNILLMLPPILFRCIGAE